MRNISPELALQYGDALETFLDKGGEAPLHEAYEFGRRALDSGMSPLHLLHMHQAALSRIMKSQQEPVLKQLDTANRYLLESLAPYEMMLISNAESNAALRRLNQILEEEAKRIGHALHDEAAQMLAVVYLEIAEIIREEPPESVRLHLEQIKANLDQVREQLRRLSHELRPPILDRLGLLPALRFLADGFRKRDNLSVKIQDLTATNSRFPQVVETTLYRAIQEALYNVVRHAHATQVIVSISTEDDWILCSVKDNGVGFSQDSKQKSPAARGLGLLGIQERINNLKGTFNLNSAPGQGTRLEIKVPNSVTA